MFSLISGGVNWYFHTPILRILIVGDEKCGKTVRNVIINIII